MGYTVQTQLTLNRTQPALHRLHCSDTAETWQNTTSMYVQCPDIADLTEHNQHVQCPDIADLTEHNQHVQCPDTADLTEHNQHVQCPTQLTPDRTQTALYRLHCPNTADTWQNTASTRQITHPRRSPCWKATTASLENSAIHWRTHYTDISRHLQATEGLRRHVTD